MMNGAEALWAALASAGVDTAFGLPGTQSIVLHEALRRSSVRSVVATSELAAAFMAVGYFRASGRVAAVSTIPGPGFTYALTGLAEALHDSAGLLHLFGRAPTGGRPFQFQVIDQRAIASPLLKGIVELHRREDASEAGRRAVALASTGEPGPVGIEWDAEALSGTSTTVPVVPVGPLPAEFEPGMLEEAVRRMRVARRPVLLVGGGGCSGAGVVRSIAEGLRAPVLTTVSGRGVVPEDHPLSLAWDAARSGVSGVNEVIRGSDCVLALGCKLTAAATALFRLELPPERLIRVDASQLVLEAGYPASLSFVAKVEDWGPRFLAAVGATGASPGSTWTEDEVADQRRTLRENSAAAHDPVVNGVEPRTPAALFASIRKALPRDGIVVTDSGLHQELTRRHLDVLAPRGLVTPSDYQSMGFGIPAAIGAALAAPSRRVVAVVGDGGFAMGGMELLTAARERIPLTVVVLADGYFNRIRLQQFEQFGRSSDVDLVNPDFGAFAEAVGASHVRIDGDPDRSFAEAFRSPGVSLVEVRLGDSAGIRVARARGLARHAARSALGPRLSAWLKRGRKRA
jgi:acetolactate synthase-1/2/3 large subunit